MTRERLYLFDTTLRDGQQTQGVQFSALEKVQIAHALDTLGIDYIEGGWPGANMIHQPSVEAALRASLAARAPGALRSGWEMLSFSQDAQGVTTHFATPEGEEQELKFEVKDGRVKFEVPKFLVYAIARVQLDK